MHLVIYNRKEIRSGIEINKGGVLSMCEIADALMDIKILLLFIIACQLTTQIFLVCILRRMWS